MWLRFIKNRPAASGTIKCPLHPLPPFSFIFILFCIYYDVTIVHLQTICINATVSQIRASTIVEKREKSLIWAIRFGPSFASQQLIFGQFFTKTNCRPEGGLLRLCWVIYLLLGWCWLVCRHFVCKILVHSSLVRSVQPSIIVHSRRKRKTETLHLKPDASQDLKPGLWWQQCFISLSKL